MSGIQPHYSPQGDAVHLTHILQQILESAGTLADATRGTLGVLGNEHNLTDYVQFGGQEEARDPRGEQMIRHVIDAGEPVHWNRPGAMVGAPIRTEDGLFGALCLWGKTDGGEFTQHDEDIVVSGAGTAGRALQNIELLRRVEHHREWLEASNAVTSALLTGADPESTLQRIVESARSAANASGAALLRPQRDADGVLSVDVVNSDEDATSLVGFEVSMGDTPAGAVFATKRPTILRDLGNQTLIERPDGRELYPAMVKDLDSAIVVPLVVAGESVGVLVVSRFSNAVPFTEEDVSMIESFAAHASMVLEFSRAEHDRRRLAVLEDRHRIARDLHDVVVQRLYLIGLQLQALSSRAGDTAPKNVSEIIGQLDIATQDIRASIYALEGQPTTRDTVRAQVWQLVHGFNDVLGFEPWVAFDGPVDSAVPEDVLPDLFAAVREALSNVARHASATSAHVKVAVDAAGRELTLTVTDDGVGVADEPHRHSGVANLEARAHRWAGTFALRPAPGAGTMLEWRICLPPRALSDGQAD